MRNFLIPANSKKSRLILGFFTPIDLMVFSIGAATTLIALLIIKDPDFKTMIGMILPLLTGGFLVMPVPHYHNIMQLLVNIIVYFTNRRHYYWKGWCITDEQ